MIWVKRHFCHYLGFGVWNDKMCREKKKKSKEREVMRFEFLSAFDRRSCGQEVHINTKPKRYTYRESYA